MIYLLHISSWQVIHWNIYISAIADNLGRVDQPLLALVGGPLFLMNPIHQKEENDCSVCFRIEGRKVRTKIASFNKKR